MRNHNTNGWSTQTSFLSQAIFVIKLYAHLWLIFLIYIVFVFNLLVCYSQWKANLLSLSRLAAGQSLTVNQLVDMEWRFGVTAADSDMKKVGNTFLQLKLVLDKGVGTEEVFMGKLLYN